MKNLKLLLLLCAFGAFARPLSAQFAEVQAIHNSGDPAAAVVDVYANGVLFIDDLAYRTATDFELVAAGVPYTIGVAPATSNQTGGGGASDIIASFGPYTFTNGQKVVIIAQGVLNPTQFQTSVNANIGFELEIISPANTSGSNPALVDVAVSHGSTDAPAVDIFVNDNPVALLNDVPYGATTGGYLSVPPARYVFGVAASADSLNRVAEFYLDATGLAGGAAVVFASGFLTTGDEPAGALPFGLFAALPDGTVAALTPVGEAKAQVIHNSGDPMAATVDIYVDLITSVVKVDDFSFRDATPFVNLPSGYPVTIGVAPANSTSIADAIATFPFTLNDGQEYVILAQGVIFPPLFQTNVNANIGFELEVLTPARSAGSNPALVDVAVSHGSTDAPAVDIFVNDNPVALLNNVPYGATTGGYLSVPAAEYVFGIAASADSTNRVASYYLDASGLAGGAAVVFASGFLTPGNEPAGALPFGLFAALPDGTVAALTPIGEAKAQVIHNSGDPAAATVDVYIDIISSVVKVDNFNFRDATPFVNLPSGYPVTVGIAPANSASIADAIATFPFTLNNGQEYVILAQGVLNPAQFQTNVNANIGFELEVLTPARSAGANPALVDVAVSHGSTDAPTVDVFANDIPNALLNNVPYGATTGGYLSVPAAEYVFGIAASADSTNRVASFYLDASGLAGGAAVVFASGFLTPGDEPAGALPFGLFAALPNGTVVALTPIGEAKAQVIHNSGDPAAATVDVYIDLITSVVKVDNFNFRTATPFVNLPSGYPVTVGIAPANSTSIADAIATFPFTLNDGQEYVILAQGVLNPAQFQTNVNANIGFELEVLTPARSAGANPALVDVAVSHGSTDAPAVDVFANDIPNALLNNVPYGATTGGYLSVPAAEYVFGIAASADSTNRVASFYLDASGLAGGAAVVFASGFLTPGDEPAGALPFGLFAALADGTVAALTPVGKAKAQVIHNAADPAAATVDIYVNTLTGIAKLDNVPFRGATAFLDLPAGYPLTIAVAGPNSASIADAIASFETPALADGEAYYVIANGVLTPASFVANPDGRNIGFNLFYQGGARTQGSGAGVDVAVFHGVTDAPTVDVLVNTTTPPFVDNAAYGDYAPYQTVPPADYTLNLTPGNNNTNILLSYSAPLSTLGGRAAIVLASGFLSNLSDPMANAGGQPFALMAVLDDGTVVILPQASTSLDKLPVQGVSLEALYPNPSNGRSALRLNLDTPREITVSVTDLQGRSLLYTTLNVGAGSQDIPLDLSKLAAGMYQVELRTQGQRIAVTRLQRL